MGKKAINIVWFKRDLRLTDHEPLYHAQQSGLPILLVYFFEPSVMTHDDSDVRHWRFVYESILDLQAKLDSFSAKIYYFHNELIPVYLLAMFAKNEQENLTKAERNELAKLTTLLVQTWEKRNKSK